MNGFRIYMNLDKVKSLPAQDVEVKDVAPTSVDDMLNLIYALDPLTGLPGGAISMYLSDKTNQQVRDFIEKNILVDHDNGEHDFPASIREDILKLDSEFIAKTSRNRYESREDYEARVEHYFNEIEKQKDYDKKLALIQKKYGKKDEVRS